MRLRVVELAARQHVGPAHHGVQRRPQLVGQRREELVLQPVRPLGLGAGDPLVLEQLQPILGLTLERFLDPPLRRGVAKHQHRADHAALPIADRRATVRDRQLGAVAAAKQRVVRAGRPRCASLKARSAGLGAGVRVSLADHVEHRADGFSVRPRRRSSR